jgi:hypothetical protein
MAGLRGLRNRGLPFLERRPIANRASRSPAGNFNANRHNWEDSDDYRRQAKKGPGESRLQLFTRGSAGSPGCCGVPVNCRIRLERHDLSQ